MSNERRPQRKIRRDHGGLTAKSDSLSWRDSVVFILAQYEFPEGGHNDIIDEIHDSLSFRAHRPSGVLREIDERDDLAELEVRIEDVLDSLHAMANETRCRVLDVLESAGSQLDPLDMQWPLRQLRWAANRALSAIPAGRPRSGRPKYDDIRETPVSASFLVIWFAQFRGDPGVIRHGDYSESNRHEYEGRLLDFVVAMFKAVGIDNAGSPGAIGRRIFQKTHKNPDGSKTSLQDRIRSRFPALSE